MPVKALNSGNWGYYSWWSSAIIYAVDNGASVINMSMGGTGYSQSLRDAVLYAYNANVPVVAAMMNNGNSTPYYPAAFSETIAVGATDRYDNRASFSSFGNHIDLVAPGVSVLSTFDDQVGYPWEDIPGWDLYYGAGRLNAVQALGTVLSMMPDIIVSPSSHDFGEVPVDGNSSTPYHWPKKRYDLNTL